MKPTIVGLVTPHLLRVVDLGYEAEKGVNVDWHLRDVVGRTMAELGQQYNAQALVEAYVEGLEVAARGAGARKAYARVLEAAAAAARQLAPRE